jgi:hypothetical protein
MNRRELPWMTLCAWSLAGSLVGCGGTTETHVDEDVQSDAATLSDATTADSASTIDVPLTFTAVCKADTECKDGKCVDGVCVLTPTEVGNLSDPANDYEPSTETLQTACVDQPLADQIKGLPDVKTVTIWGRVDRFGGGDITSNVEVDVFKLSDFHPEACAGIVDEDLRATCFQNPAKVGTPLAHTISLDPDQAAVDAKLDVQSKDKAGDTCVTHFDCPNGYECRKVKTDTSKICIKAHGVYAVENVPTNTELVVRVRKHDPNADWHDSYYWDIVLFSDHLDPKGAGNQPTKYIGADTYHVNPTIVGQGQWQLVPQTLGLGDITDGNGVVGGRIRDCGNLKRGGFPIHDAKVGMGIPPAGLAFFNDNEDDTVPIKNKQSTDTLGRFAAVDLPPGANRVSASVMLGTDTIKLGSQDVFVVPGALMIVSLPGRIPVLTK